MTNSDVERFNRSILKSIRALHSNGKVLETRVVNVHKKLHQHSHATAKQTLAELLFKMRNRTRLPQLPAKKNVNNDVVGARDEQAKRKMKTHAHKRNNAMERHVIVEDRVLVKQDKKNKRSTSFDNRHCSVAAIQCPILTAQ